MYSTLEDVMSLVYMVLAGKGGIVYMIPFDFRVQAMMSYDERKVWNMPSDPRLTPFTELIWDGRDEAGWCVYRRNPYSFEVVRIDFLPPLY